jgi:hypothetical protein
LYLLLSDYNQSLDSERLRHYSSWGLILILGACAALNVLIYLKIAAVAIKRVFLRKCMEWERAQRLKNTDVNVNVSLGMSAGTGTNEEGVMKWWDKMFKKKESTEVVVFEAVVEVKGKGGPGIGQRIRKWLQELKDKFKKAMTKLSPNR